MKTAFFSDDRVYRYTLSRIWLPGKPYICFVGLNPSKADENIDDPTIRRCIGYAMSWGYGGIVMVNLFAFRSTDPKNLLSATDPIGPDNYHHIFSNSWGAALTIAAWGVRGGYLGQDKKVRAQLTNPHCLALTKEGHPKHPLYLKKDLRPVPYLGMR